jgi:hypothetical protein
MLQIVESMCREDQDILYLSTEGGLCQRIDMGLCCDVQVLHETDIIAEGRIKPYSNSASARKEGCASLETVEPGEATDLWANPCFWHS